MQSAIIYCSSCGAGNRSQATFCFSCGQKMLIGTPPPLTPKQLLVGGTGRLTPQHLLNQRYIIVKLLGQGGMGAVYQATDTQFGNRVVAVKEMSQNSLDAQEALEAAKQFKQEAHLLAGLKHPNLPSIYDHFTEDGRWYLVMDFIEGDTLDEHINKTPNHILPTTEVLTISIQLTKVLSYLHTRPTPIIFRDLKPSNIMITPDEQIYLIDFGIARLFKPGKAKDTTAYGSPGYAAPEQFNHEQTSPLSDIYSLGATLYHLLSGHNPRSNTPTIFHFEPLQAYNPTLPPALSTMVLQMVNIDKSQRPTSMIIIRKELENIQKQLQYTPTQAILPVQLRQQRKQQQKQLRQQRKQLSQIKSPLPRYGLLRALPIGIVAGIICISTATLIQNLIGLWFIIVLVTCIMTGFLTGKIAVARRIGFFSGAIAGLVVGFIGSIMGGDISSNLIPDIIATIVALVIGGLLSLFGTWLATRKHPYYMKKVRP